MLVLREDAGGVSLVVSRVSDSPFVLPVMEIVAARDPFAAGPVAGFAKGLSTDIQWLLNRLRYNRVTSIDSTDA